MISKDYSIQNDITSGQVNLDRLKNEIQESSIIIALDYLKSTGDVLTIKFKANISTSNETGLDSIVANHNGEAIPKAKIHTIAGHDYQNWDHRDIDYVLHPKSNLFPKRTVIKGEVVKVEWFSDSDLTDLVLKAEMTYTRDPYGFALSRTVTRTWYDEAGNPLPDQKITTKVYSNNPADQIKEGKRRRSNIVDSIQLPTMGLMIEAMTVAPYNYSTGQILLIGRDFLDRHEQEFNNFINNSSSVTDFNDPNFGRKKVAVAIEAAANSTDPWLKETPATLQGASIEQYLVGEFTI